MAQKGPPGTDRERGQAIVLLVLALIALAAFVGLATDVALLYAAEANLQRAVDAAALAAANKLPNQDEARAAAYEFTRLHGYTFDPASNPLDIDFPIEDPPRKLAIITGTVEVELGFLRVIGRQTAPVTAVAEGESAPLDVYLVLDLSNSMAYDTPRPAWWNAQSAARIPRCLATGCPSSLCHLSASESWEHCRAYWCNDNKHCDPLDEHIKDSAQFFVRQLDSRYDRIGVIGYDVEGSVAVSLTNDFEAVETAITGLEAFEPYGVPPLDNLCTNIGDGLLYANHFMSLSSPEEGGAGGRPDSIWAVILLTDGRANRYRQCAGCPDNCDTMPACRARYCDPWTGSCPQADNWAVANAWSSWNKHKIIVYTIAYGDIFFDYPSYRKLMIDIADITDNGELDGSTENFWAVPDEAGLRQALAEIAERIYTRLTR